MISFPEKSESPEKIRLRIDTMSSEDAAWENGKVFGFIYKPPREAAEFIEEVFGRYFYHSTLNPFTFPSICRMENEIVGMVAQLLHGERHTVGNLTTGGTESILMSQPLLDEAIPLEQTSDNFRWAAAVAEFGMLLRDSAFKGDATYQDVLALAQNALGEDESGFRFEFTKLVETAELLDDN